METSFVQYTCMIAEKGIVGYILGYVPIKWTAFGQV